MTPRKAQIIWSSIVAVGVALVALYSVFASKPVSHVFFRAGPTPASSLVKDSFVIR